MGKKHKHKYRHHHHQPPWRPNPFPQQQPATSADGPAAPPPPPADPFAELEKVIQSGRGRKALTLANELVKRPELTDAQIVLLITAYELRTREMVEDGHLRDAIEFHQNLKARFPQWKSRFSLDVTLVLECAGARPDTLLRYPADPEMTEAIAAAIRRQLRDPRALLKHPELPAAHPLKQEAEAIVRGWEAIERGDDSRGLEILSAIGRRSTFNHWRLLAQAIQAFYQQDDARCQSFLERIPGESAVHPAAQALQALIHPQASASKAAQELSRSIHVNDLRQQLQRLDTLILEGKNDRAKQQLLEIIPRLQAAGHRLMCVDLVVSALLRKLTFMKSMPQPEFARVLAKDQLDRVTVRLAYALKENVEDQLLDHLHSNQLKHTDMERALLYRALAIGAADDRTEPNPFHYFKPRPTPKKELRERSGNYFNQSLKCHSLRETYQLWHATFNQRGWKTHHLLKQWHRAFPEDERPLTQMLLAARRSQSTSLMDTYYQKLKDLLIGSPSLLRQEPYIRVEQAIAKLTKKPTQTLSPLLAAIPDRPTIVAVARECLAWHYAAPEEKARRAQALLALKHPVLVLFCLERVNPKLLWPHLLPKEFKAQIADVGTVFADYLEFTRVDDEIWSQGEFGAQGVFFHSLRSPTAPKEALAQLLKDLTRQYPYWRHPTAMHVGTCLTANGLRRHDLARADILLYRALIYLACVEKSGDPMGTSFSFAKQKIFELLTAAEWLVERSGGDRSLHQKVCQCIPGYRDCAPRLTWNDAQIEKLVTIEKGFINYHDLDITINVFPPDHLPTIPAWGNNDGGVDEVLDDRLDDDLDVVSEDDIVQLFDDMSEELDKIMPPHLRDQFLDKFGDYLEAIEQGKEPPPFPLPMPLPMPLPRRGKSTRKGGWVPNPDLQKPRPSLNPEADRDRQPDFPEFH